MVLLAVLDNGACEGLVVMGRTDEGDMVRPVRGCTSKLVQERDNTRVVVWQVSTCEHMQ